MCLIKIKAFPTCGNLHLVGPPELCALFKKTQKQAGQEDWDPLEGPMRCANARGWVMEAVRGQSCPSCNLWYFRASKPIVDAKESHTRDSTGRVEEGPLGDESTTGGAGSES